MLIVVSRGGRKTRSDPAHQKSLDQDQYDRSIWVLVYTGWSGNRVDNEPC